MRTSESIKNIAAALLAAQKEMTHPKKNATNPHLRNKFADLPCVIDTLKAALNKNGIVVIQSVGYEPLAEGALLVKVTTRFLHESGEWTEDTAAQPVQAQKGLNLSQAIGSAITYLRRYGPSAMGFVASEPDDDGNEGKGDGGGTTPNPTADFEL